MKRIICIVMVLLTAALVFAACGKKEVEETTTKPTETTGKDVPIVADYFDNTETQKNGETTEYRPDIVDSEGKGIEIIYGSAPQPGQLATVSAKGKANAEFSAVLYDENATAIVNDIKNVKSDGEGKFGFSFIIPDNTKVGSKLLVIREVGTENYLRTTIYVSSAESTTVSE